jgi:hypothetical protein
MAQKGVEIPTARDLAEYFERAYKQLLRAYHLENPPSLLTVTPNEVACQDSAASYMDSRLMEAVRAMDYGLHERLHGLSDKAEAVSDRVETMSERLDVLSGRAESPQYNTHPSMARRPPSLDLGFS